MEVIVTGGAGFVGTNLIKRLLKDGQVTNRIISIDNYSTGKKENEQEGCKYFDFDWYHHFCIPKQSKTCLNGSSRANQK